MKQITFLVLILCIIYTEKSCCNCI